jgi:Flp pilus assembly protein TadG
VSVRGRGLRRLVAVGDSADADRGAASVFVLGMIVVLMVLAGLVVDGGRAVNARVAVIDDAEQAARVAANQLSQVPVRSGAVTIDAVAATNAASAYLTARGYEASGVVVTVDAGEVSVRVTDTVPTTLLQLAFINSYTVEGAATASAAMGIVNEITGAP